MGTPYVYNDEGESNCCGAGPIGEIHDGFARCSQCLEMAKFEPEGSDHEIEGPSLVMPIKDLTRVIMAQSNAFSEVLDMFASGIEVGGITINDGLQERVLEHIKKQQENLEYTKKMVHEALDIILGGK